MATLIGKTKSTIINTSSMFFGEGEMDEKLEVRKFQIITRQGIIY